MQVGVVPVVSCFSLMGLLLSLLAFGGLTPLSVYAGDPSGQALDPSAPDRTVRLVFIHHSTGENWLNDALRAQLNDNNYFVVDTNYGWGPACVELGGTDTIGDHTDIPHWYLWFTGSNRDTYLSALYTDGWSADLNDGSKVADPGGVNTIVMFKSCFPNSDMYGNPTDPPADSADYTSPLDVAHAKRIYLDLLPYFASRQDKLFVAICAPPLVQSATAPERAANARAFNNWLVNEWLQSYPYNNVAVFDFFNVLTSNGGNPNTNDLGSETGNHHRYRNGVIEHVINYANNYSRYGSGDSHPTAAGNEKAAVEFLPLLNIFYHRWQGGSSTKTASVASAKQGETVNYTIVVRDSTVPPTTTVYLTDIVPSGLTYVNNSLVATSGTAVDTGAPTLKWSGVLSPTPVVTITYAVTVSTGTRQAATNRAEIAAPGSSLAISRTATVVLNPSPLYMPIMRKD